MKKVIFIFCLILGVQLTYAQSNDCSTATTITPGATCVNTTGTTAGATQSIPGCVGTADDDVWYQFTASATSHQITVTPSAGFDPVVQLFSGACSALSTISCMDNGLTGEAETIFASGLTAGQVYRIRVYHYYAGAPTTTTFSICVTNPPPIPSNNDCSGATSISVNTSCTTTAGTSVGATQSTPGCAGTADDDVWYKFVATNAVQTITVDPSVNMDPVVELYSGTCAALTSISCMDQGFTDGNEVISAVGLTPGTTYYVRVYDYYSSTGGAPFTICVVGAATAAPVNDEPCNAINLPAVTTTCNYLTFSSLGATTTASPGAPSSCSGGSAPQQGGYAAGPRDVWFAITVPSTGNITVTIKPGIASPMNDMVFVLYSGACGSLTQITCSDDYDYPGSANDMQPFINRTGLTPGSTVYLRVFRFGNASQFGGDFGLCVSTNTNDACANALYICDLNGYSASTSAAFTADRPGSGAGQMYGNNETAAGVNLTDGTNSNGPFGYYPPSNVAGTYSSPAIDVNIENNSWIRFTAGATTAVLNVTVGNCFVGAYPTGGIQMQIFSATACNNFLPKSQFKENSTGFTITATGLTIGSDYYLMVDGYANDVCNYTISANSGVQFPDIIATANPICSGASTLLTAPSGATAYEWQPGGATTQTLTVSPSTTTTYTCFVSGVCGQRQSLTKTITVNQLPSMTSSATPTAFCSGGTVGLVLTSDIPSTYSWVAASNTDVTGESTSAQAGSTITNTLTVTSLTNEDVIYTVTPTSNAANGSCSGPAQTVTVTVKPRPTLTDPSDQSVCGGAAVAATNFATNISGSTVSWTNTNTNSGINGVGITSASSSGDISTYTAPLVVATQTTTITATPTLNSCAGTAQTFTIGIKPTPVIAATGTTVCGGTTVSVPTFTVTPSSTVNWTNGNTAIGSLAASGSANIPNFTASTPTVSTSSTFTASTTLNGCAAANQNFTVTVNPTPVLSAITGQTVCGGASVNAINFTTTPAAGPTIAWSNNNPGASGIGLAASGTTNIASYTAPTVSSTQSGTVTVTPTMGTCVGSAKTFTIVVNPTPVITAVTNTTVCGNTFINAVNFSATPASSVSWTSSSTSTGLSVANGTGGVPSFTSANVGSLTTSTVSLNTTLNSCPAAQIQYTITVNPLPTLAVTPTEVQSACGLSTGALNGASASGSGSLNYVWTNSSNVQVGTTANITNMPAGAYNLTVTDANCTAAFGPFSITNPGAPSQPTATAVDNILCVGEALSLSSTSSEVSPTFAWSGPNASSGTSTLNIGSVSLADAGTYTVTVTVSNCTSTNTISVVVNPNPVAVATNASNTYCSGNTIDLFGSGGTGYNWSGPNSYNSTNQNPQLTPADTLMSGTYTLIVTDAQGCTGTGTTSVLVNHTPSTPSLSATPSNMCVGDTITLNAISTGTGTITYSWTGPNSFSSGLQNPVINTVSTLESGIYTVVASASNCNSAAATLTITVNSNPVVTMGISGSPVCSGNNVTLSASGGTSYSWTGPNTFVSGSPTPLLTATTPQMSGTYTVQVTDATTCSTIDSVTLVVNPTPGLPVITASATTLCEGDNLQLTAASTGTGTISYSWSGPDGFTSAIANPLINNVTNLASGTYTVTASTPDCSSPSETVSIVVNPTPVATAAISSAIICSGNNIDLSSTGGTTFSWTGPNGYTSSSANNTLTNVDATFSGVYTFTAINPGNCTDVATVSLIVNTTPSLPVITANASTLCEGDDLQLNAVSTGTGTINYSWTGPNGFTSLISNPLITNVTTSMAGVYTVISSTPDCSSPSETISIAINATPVAIASISATTICSGNNIDLMSSGGTTFNWAGPNGYTSSQANNTLTNVGVTASGTYTFTATNPGNCTDVATVSLAVTQTPAAAVTTGDSTCVGNPLLLTAAGTGTINWYDDAALTNLVSTGGIFNPALATNTSGIYYVTVSNSGCTSTTSTVVASNYNINASFNASALSGYAPLPVVFTNTSTGVGASDTYSWLISNSQFATTYNSTYDFTQGGTFNVDLIIIDNPSGCRDTASVTVVIDDEIRVVIPNVFSPNGDGINDGFTLDIKGGKDAEGTIFNRWGQVLHHWDALNVVWDGKVPNGEKVSDGVYFYIIKVTGYNGKVLDVPGNVTIVR